MGFTQNSNPTDTGLELLSKQFPVTEICLRTPSGEPLRAKVDTEDLVKIFAVSTLWHAYWHPGSKTHYVLALRGGKKIYLHRVVTDAPPGLVVDHIHHDGLDNRKSELRVVSQGENSRNARRKANKSGIRGVYHSSKNGGTKPWKATVKLAGKLINLGWFAQKEVAGQAVTDFYAKHDLIPGPYRQDSAKGATA